MNRFALILFFLPGLVPALAAENLAVAKQPTSIDRRDHDTRRVAVPLGSGPSFYLSAMQAGIPADVVSGMINAFAYRVDFQRNFHPGDSIECYYEAKGGIVRYTAISVSGNKIEFYRYQPHPNSAAVYFDAAGHSANGKMVLSGTELRAFSDAKRKIRATVAAALLDRSN